MLKSNFLQQKSTWKSLAKAWRGLCLQMGWDFISNSEKKNSQIQCYKSNFLLIEIYLEKVGNYELSRIFIMKLENIRIYMIQSWQSKVRNTIGNILTL